LNECSEYVNTGTAMNSLQNSISNLPADFLAASHEPLVNVQFSCMLPRGSCLSLKKLVEDLQKRVLQWILWLSNERLKIIYATSLFHKKRLRDYIAFYESGSWESETDRPFPVVLFVCPTKALLIYLKRYVKKLTEGINFRQISSSGLRLLSGSEKREWWVRFGKRY